MLTEALLRRAAQTLNLPLSSEKSHSALDISAAIERPNRQMDADDISISVTCTRGRLMKAAQ